MQEATMQHLGIAILPDWNAADGLRSGELEHVLPDYNIAALPLHAVYPETHWMSLRARSFLDLLVERAGHFSPAPTQSPPPAQAVDAVPAIIT
jgi:DNA-binding transcriptional LysR family regulator